MTQILRSTQKQPEGEKEMHETGSDLPTDTSALLSQIHPTGDSERTEKTEKRLTDGVRASTQTAWIQIPSATSLEPEPPHSCL